MDLQTEVRVVLKATGFICLVLVGVPANLSVLLLFCHLRFTRGCLPPNDFILTNLAAVNLLVLFCRGIPQTLVALGLKHFMNDWGCKVVIFSYRMSRAMSICVTALLGCYQSVSVSPATPRWTVLKRWLTDHLPHAITIFWILNVFICHAAILHTQTPSINGSIPEYTLNLEFCIVVFPGFEVYMVHGVMYTVRDVAFVGVMVLAAGYMLLVLYHHRQQMKALGGGSQVSASASQAVLLLMCTYVALFGLENMLRLYQLSLSRVVSTISDARVFFASCYSALSPILIIATNRRLSGRFQCFSSAKKAAGDASTHRESSISHITA